MFNFLNSIKKEANLTTTENNALTYYSTLSDCLDLFYRIGALRQANEQEITSIIERAYTENKDYTFRILFFARDIRGGLGERRVFRISMDYLAKTHTDSVLKNLELFSEYGRWDDLINLYNCNVKVIQKSIISIIKQQLNKDIQNMNSNNSISLLAKWIPSINASNKDTISLAKKISKELNMSYKEYRQTISKLRKYLDILENRLRTKDYSFDYSKQPSKAMIKYRQAFFRNDADRYMNFLQSVKNGETKINTGTLYPYDIVRQILNNRGKISKNERTSLDVTWNSLPSVNIDKNSIAVIDGSGSMYMSYRCDLLPYQVAISLGLYFAEHSTGAFANHFITFSSNPRLVEVKGKDIVDKVNYISTFNECSNTNIQGVFDLILNTAIHQKLPQKELPDTIYIISDMEFDNCAYNNNQRCTNFDCAKQKFEQHGYKLPNVVFWNVASRNQQVPVTKHQSGALLVSGSTAKIFDMVQTDKLNPEQFMLDIINGERYNKIFA